MSGEAGHECRQKESLFTGTCTKTVPKKAKQNVVLQSGEGHVQDKWQCQRESESIKRNKTKRDTKISKSTES